LQVEWTTCHHKELSTEILQLEIYLYFFSFFFFFFSFWIVWNWQ
jgi:hypothetical protein